MGNPDEASRKELERIRSEFQRAWEGNLRPEISGYLTSLNATGRIEALKVLIPLDIQFRLRSGEVIDCNAYSQLGEPAVAIAEQSVGNRATKTAADQFATIPGAPSTPVSESVWRQLSSYQGKELLADRYRLINQIGQGGMGAVWLAQQEKPVRRRVAIKVINSAMGSGEAISRFEAERQALAMMNHPNIAKVLDAGTTQDGQPFFVMELVKGVPITQYCTDHRLSNRKRLELMITVCEAVQHAHQKGIIHRDLKPSNILITVEADQPVPKVIDFGLAKALESGARLTDQTIITEYGRVVGTLQYMSPEQAGSHEMDIDTRTDVYSIGVLLHQLLTDIIPLDQENLSGKYLLQIIELICKSEIQRPSISLARNVESVPEAARQRQTEPNQLIRSLRGELDWIVLKALEKDRVNRYQTANGVALDIQRYLNDEPVAARPPSNTYLLKKYIRKYQGLAISIAAAALLLIAGTIVSMYFAFDANQARGKAETAKQRADDEKKNALAAEELARKQFGVFIKSFASTNVLDGARQDMTAVDVLGEAETYLKLDLQNDPLGQAGMLHEIGKAYRGRSRFDRSVNSLTQAFELRISELGPEDVRTCESLIELAKSRMEFSKDGVPAKQKENYLTETLKMADDACLGLAKSLAGNDESMMVANKDLGTAYLFAFKELNKLGIVRRDYIEKAISILTRTYEMQEEKLGPEHGDTLTTHTNLTNALLKGGNVDQAIEMSLKALDTWSKLHAQAESETEKRKYLARISNARNNYGEALQEKGELELAIRVYQQALLEKEQVLGVGHAIWFNTVRGLLDSLLADGQLENARLFFETTRQKLEKVVMDFPDSDQAKQLERIRKEVLTKHRINEQWNDQSSLNRASIPGIYQVNGSSVDGGRSL